MPDFQDLLQAIGRRSVNERTADEARHLLASHGPQHFTVADLVEGIVEPSGTNRPSISLPVIAACLADKERVQKQPDDEAAVQRLCAYAAASIAPCSEAKENPDELGDHDTDGYEEASQRSRHTAGAGLAILQTCSVDYSALLSDDALLTVIAFTDGSDPWVSTTTATQPSAARLVADQLARWHADQDDLLVDAVLKRYLRRLFSRSRPTTVTAAGRKAEFAREVDAYRGLADENADVKPWKYADHRAIPVFHWVVRTADDALISRQWPLFIPVLLTLLDDSTTRIRARGLEILAAFLDKFPNNILHDTGLASVFEDAVFPTLHFLPSLTPEEESVQLIPRAFSALLKLASKLEARTKAGSTTSSGPRAAFLDKLLRDGVFPAYFHAKEHVCIVEQLLVQTKAILYMLGIQSVKHLKDLIPMLSEIMTNPFVTLAPGVLFSAFDCLRAILENCWPRLSTPAYQDEIIKILATCFLHIHDDKGSSQDSADTEAAILELGSLYSTFFNAKSTGGDGGDSFQDKIAPLVVKEPLLARLFEIEEPPSQQCTSPAA